MARQFTRPLDLYKQQVKRFASFNRDIKRMHRDLAEQGLGDARELTSGGLSSRQLRAMGHPYGRGAAQGSAAPTGLMRGARLPGMRQRVRPLPINRQSGLLRGSMRLRSAAGGVQSFVLGSGGIRYASYVLHPAGTKKMIGRGYFIEVKKRWRARNKALIDTMLRRQRTY